MAFNNIGNNSLKITSFFLVILGEHDDNRINTMVGRMNSLGKCVQIMERTYILTTIGDNVVTTSELRSKVSGENSYIILVFKLDVDSAAAWCLKTDNSNYLKSVFDELKEI